MPHEQLLVQRFRNKPFALLGVNVEENREAAVRMIQAHRISWRNWQAGGDGNPIQKSWPVEMLPTLYVIDAKGIVRHAGVGGANLENAVEKLLAEAEQRAN